MKPATRYDTDRRSDKSTGIRAPCGRRAAVLVAVAMPRERAEGDLRRKLRRATRDDVGLLARIMGGPERGRIRTARRILAGLVSDVYLAVEADGSPVGVVMVAYRRSLSQGGLVAEIDLLRCVAPLPPEARDEVVGLLLEGAVIRARRRGCVAIWAAEEDEDRARLLGGSGFEAFAGRRLLPLRTGDA